MWLFWMGCEYPSLHQLSHFCFMSRASAPSFSLAPILLNPALRFFFLFFEISISLGKYIFYIGNGRIHYWDALKSSSQLIPEHLVPLSVSLDRCPWEENPKQFMLSLWSVKVCAEVRAYLCWQCDLCPCQTLLLQAVFALWPKPFSCISSLLQLSLPVYTHSTLLNEVCPPVFSATIKQA